MDSEIFIKVNSRMLITNVIIDKLREWNQKWDQTYSNFTSIHREK